MLVTNFQIHKDLPFGEYQKLPGNSFSSIKHDGREFETTSKMILGTQVHQYLLEPHKFTGDIRIVKPMATALIRCLGALWQYLDYEISVTCNFEHEGFVFPYRGRIDAGIRRKIIIDFKIGENVRKSMEHFDYPTQLSGYAIAYEAPLALIIAMNPKKLQLPPDIIPVHISDEFWKNQILLKGEVV